METWPPLTYLKKETMENREPCPVRGSGGAGFDGCVNMNCKAGRCMAIRKNKNGRR